MLSEATASPRPQKPTPTNLGISLILILILGAASGCAGIKKQQTVSGGEGSAEGQWRGRAHVRDLKNGKSGTIDLEILAKEPESLRLEATSAFGTSLASVAMSGGEVKMILPQQKKFVISPVGRGSFGALLPVSISPDSLLRLLFDRPLDRGPSKWKCASGTPASQWSCEDTAQLTVTRQADENGSRRFQIRDARAEVQLVLTEAKAKVQATDSIYALEAPAGYSREVRDLR